MIEIKIKNTNIRIKCLTAEEAFLLYQNLAHQHKLIINGEELESPKKIGPNHWFAGYTRNFFEKYEPINQIKKQRKEKHYV